MKGKNYLLLASMLLCTFTGIAQSVTPSAARFDNTKISGSTREQRGSMECIDRANNGTARQNAFQQEEPTTVYLQSFEKDCDWKVIDAANKMTLGKISGQYPIDGEYNLLSGYDQKAARNAWAISPAIPLEKDKTYYVSVWCYVPGFENTPEEFEIVTGNSANMEDLTNVLLDYKGDKAFSSKEWQKVQTTFTPEESGDYYFSIHHCTSSLYVNVTGFDRFYIGTEPDTFVQVIPVPRPTPEGEQLNYMTYFDDVYYGYTEKGGKVVYGEKDSVFIQGIAAQMPLAWVYGIKKGNTIEIPVGQYLGIKQSLSGSNDMYLFAGTDYVPNENNPAQFTYTPMESLQLRIDGDNLKTDEGIVIVQSASKSGVPYNGAIHFEMRPFNEKAIIPSASAEKKIYEISYTSTKNNGGKVSYMTNVALSGDTVFIQKASYYMQYMTDSWIYGISNGKTITFPSGQYIGNYIGDAPFPTYLYGATVTGTDEDGENTYELKENYTLNIEGDTFSSPDYYVMHLGGIISEGCHDLTLKEFKLIPAIPAAATDLSCTSVPADNLRIYYEPKDQDGNRILEDSLYFRIYFDDELYTLIPTSEGGNYKNLTRKMTEIPVGFSDGYDIFGTLSQNRCQIYVYAEFEKVSIEMVYHMGDKIGTSPRIVWTRTDGLIGTEGEGGLTGIHQPGIEREIVHTITYNVYGQPVRPDEKGILIKVDTFDDGSIQSRKVFNK